MNLTQPQRTEPMRAQPWRRLFQVAGFVGGYLIFGVGGLLTSLLALPFSLLFVGPKAHRVGQLFIHWLFAFFMAYLRWCGLVRFDFHALKPLRSCRGLILAANHPCLLDAVFIVSELPNVFCLMKASLARNSVLCGTARLAGYVANESPAGLVRRCRERLAEGGNLLVFPEGTRTRGKRVNDFKMGFALVAKHTPAAVQTVFIRSNSGYLAKGWPFFRMPEFPLIFSVALGRRFEPSPGADAKEFGRSIERYFRESTPEF